MDRKGSVNRFVKYLRDKELAENSIESYQYTVDEFLLRYGELTSDNLRAWKAWLIRDHAVQTVNLRIAAMNQYIEFRGLKLAKIKRVRVMKSLSVENVITEADYQRLIDGLTADGEFRWVAYYQILTKTGARISEALQLTINDLNKGFAIMKTKGKVRRIWLPQGLIMDVKNLFGDAESGTRLILNRYGKPMTSRGFASAMATHADKYGIPRERMHPHALRHFFCIAVHQKESGYHIARRSFGTQQRKHHDDLCPEEC